MKFICTAFLLLVLVFTSQPVGSTSFVQENIVDAQSKILTNDTTADTSQIFEKLHTPFYIHMVLFRVSQKYSYLFSETCRILGVTQKPPDFYLL